MPTQRISFRSWTKGLFVKGPVENMPPESLRIANNVYPTRGGSIKSRSGFTALYTTDAHSISKFNQNYILGVTTGLRRAPLTGTPGFPTAGSDVALSLGTATQNGNRLSFMDIPAQFLSTNPILTQTKNQLFVAGGGKPVKIGTTFDAAGPPPGVTNWGIGVPTEASINPGITITPQGVAGGSLSKTIELFNALTSTLTVSADAFAQVNDDDGAVGAVGAGPGGPMPTANIDTVHHVEGTGSLRLRLAKNMNVRAVIDPGTVDLTTFGAVPVAGEDYLSFSVRTSRPKHVKNITIRLYVGTAGTFDKNEPGGNSLLGGENYFGRELKVKLVRRKRTKSLRGSGDAIPFNPKDQARYLKRHPAQAGTDFSTQEFIDDDFSTIAVTPRAWTNVTLPLSSLDRAGLAGTTGFTFANVIGIELLCETTDGGPCTFWFDNMRLTGGFGTRGDYLWTFTFLNDKTGSRGNPPLRADGTFVMKQATLDRQSVIFSGFNTAFATIPGFPFTDDRTGQPNGQITHIEIWRNIGNGGLQFFFVGKVEVGMDTFTDDRADYVGMHSGATGSGTANYLDPNKILQLDNIPMGAAFRSAIATPTNSTDYVRQSVYHAPTGRVFALSNDFVGRIMYSPPGRPESIASFIEPVGADEGILRLVTWNESLYAFTTRRILEILNTDEPFITHDLLGSPGAIAAPSPDNLNSFSIVSTPAGIGYIAKDGPRIFDGSMSRLVAEEALEPIFRGSNDVTYPAFTPLVAAYGRNEFYISETSLIYTLVLDVSTGSWRAINGGAAALGTGPKALYYDRDNRVLLASVNSAGTQKVVSFEGGTSGELGGQPGEATPETGTGVGNFKIQTAGTFVGGGKKCIIQRVYIEADAQDQGDLRTSIIIDGVSFGISGSTGLTLSTTGRIMNEYAVNLPGYIASIVITKIETVSKLTKRIEITAIEADCYIP